MMNVLLQDPLEWLYPDRLTSLKNPMKTTIDVARGGIVSIAMVLTGLKKGKEITLASGEPKTVFSEMIDVAVQFNTGEQGFTVCNWSPKSKYITRDAPYRVFDALKVIDGGFTPRKTAAALYLQIPVARNAKPGTYTVTLSVSDGKTVKEVSFKYKVHAVTLPAAGAKSRYLTNWMSTKNFAEYGKPVKKWSKQYWDRLAEQAAMMYHARQNTFIVWLSDFFEYENGVFTLNTARLKRYIRTFTDAGLYWIEGGHFGGRVDGQWNAEDFAVMMSQNSIKSIEGNRDIAQIGRQLYAFIQKNGYADRWIQHVTDEPILCNADSYRIFVGLVRKYMPGLPLMDAMSDPEIAGAPDIWCPQIQVFEQKKDLFDAVREQGDRIWSYTCCLPGGAYLNRLLDGELTRPLLLGWGNAFYDIEGFLHWGWNQYMPYKVSATDRQNPYEETAPLEWNGKTEHTVPAGDTHIVYPGEDGSVLSSMRLESQREGMEDWELLEMLKKKDLKKAHAIIKKVFRAFNDYNADPAEIRKARKSLLEALS